MTVAMTRAVQRHTAAWTRRAGFTGAVAGVAWVPLVVWEYSADLEIGPLTAQHVANQLGFTVATVGYVVMLLGLHAARPAGSNRRARVATAAWATAWVLVLAGELAELLVGVDHETDPLPAVGGLLQGLASLVVGVLVARTSQWTGWRRWWPLVLALYFVIGMFIPAVAGHDPTMITEAIWALGYAGLGVALATSEP
jgi:hypothetical protein